MTTTGTNSATAPAPTGKTDIRETVSPALLTAVKSYIRAEAALQSKYWPLLDQALAMMEQGYDRPTVNRLFGKAYMKALGIDEPTYKTASDHASAKVVFSKITAIVHELTNDQIAVHRAANRGFWALYEMSKDGLPKDPVVRKAKITKASLEKDAEDEVANAAEYAAAFKATAGSIEEDTTKIAKSMRKIYRQDKDNFLAILKQLVDMSVLPDEVVDITLDFWSEK